MPEIRHDIAVDLDPKNRPGYPMEWTPHPAEGAHADTPRQQSPGVKVFRHGRPKSMPLVFGTAQPPKGVSGLLRAYAYKYPDHWARHWTTLMLADRVNVWERRLTKLGALAVPLGAGLFFIRLGMRRKPAVQEP